MLRLIKCASRAGYSVLAAEKPIAASDAFVKAMTAPCNKTLTENMSAAHVSTLDARLDFFSMGPTADPNTITSNLEKSWAQHPLDTLKLVFYRRNVRSGQSEKQAFYVCCDWMMKHHPGTFLHNLKHIPTHGYWKDLLQLLVIRLRSGLFDGIDIHDRQSCTRNTGHRSN